MIEAYSFGSIQVDGEKFSSDVMMGPGKLETHWWRKSGHSLCLEDLQTLLVWDLDLLVIGTGMSGMMFVSDKILSELKARGIEAVVERTGQAVKSFNEYLRQGRKVGGAFHLTC